LCVLKARESDLHSRDGSIEFEVFDRTSKTRYALVVANDTQQSHPSETQDPLVVLLARNGDALSELSEACALTSKSRCAYVREEDGRLTVFSLHPVLGRCKRVCGVLCVVQESDHLSEEIMAALVQEKSESWMSRGKCEQGTAAPSEASEHAVLFDKRRRTMSIHPQLLHWIPTRGKTNIMGQDPKMLDQLVRHVTKAQNACIVRASDMFIEFTTVSPSNTLYVDPSAKYLQGFFSSSVYIAAKTMADLNSLATEMIVQSASTRDDFYILNCISVYGETQQNILGYAFTWRMFRSKSISFEQVAKAVIGKANRLNSDKWINQLPVVRQESGLTFNSVSSVASVAARCGKERISSV
jgi:hypothetical protein